MNERADDFIGKVQVKSVFRNQIAPCAIHAKTDARKKRNAQNRAGCRASDAM
jgi:hypothetical protein